MTSPSRLYLNGEEVQSGTLTYELSRIACESPTESCGVSATTGAYEVECAVELPHGFAFPSEFATAPITCRMQWHVGKIYVAAEVEPPIERDCAEDELSLSMLVAPGSGAVVGCSQCGQRRAYANIGRATKALARWKRHVCRRGAR